MNEDEIARRVEELSPEARALVWEFWRRGAQTDFHAPPLEALDDELVSRIKALPVEEQRKFFGLFRALAHYFGEEVRRHQAGVVEADSYIMLIARAQELNSRAGRPVKEDMTTGEAVSRLE